MLTFYLCLETSVLQFPVPASTDKFTSGGMGGRGWQDSILEAGKGLF